MKQKKKNGHILESLLIGGMILLFISGPILSFFNMEELIIILFFAEIILFFITFLVQKKRPSQSIEIAKYYNLKDLTHLSTFYAPNKVKSNSKETYQFYYPQITNASNIESSIEQQIQIQDPNFSKIKFKQNAYAFFLLYNQSLIEKDLKKLQAFSTDKFLKNMQMKIDNNQNMFLINIELISDCLAKYEILPDGSEKITYQLIVKGNNPAMLYLDYDGVQCDHYYNTYRINFLRKYGIKTQVNNDIISLNCPNCGAPINDTSIKVCKHCNSSINLSTYTWKLDNIEFWKEGK